MKTFLILSFCLFFSLTAFGQPPAAPKEKPPVGIESIMLMRDDGDGNADEESAIFGQRDIPIHCQINLDSLTPATIKMNLVATEVKGLKAESKIVTVSYKTNGQQNIVNFKGSPNDIWLAGKYRVDIFVNDKLAGNKEFEIEKSNAPNVSQNNFVEPKPKAKPAPRKPRKN